MLLLVDGSNLLFQMFYGMPARIVNAQGRPIQGTVGFVGALLKIIRMVCPTHVAVLFDGECHNVRTELDSEYKANREDFSQLPEEDTPFSQLPDIFAALDYLGIRYAETTDCEADDWMAAFAVNNDGREVVIASQDSDLFQLITDQVHILRYRGEKTVLCNEQYIRQKLGIAPNQYAAFKALTGDSSDHIRGVEKVGPKTAAALLAQFGDLESILRRADEIAKPSIRASIQKNAERARLNYLLVKLDGKAPPPFAPETLVWQDRGDTSTQVLRAIGVRT